MLRALAILFGLVFLALGVLGFSPEFYQRNLFLGIFHLNFAHNVIHLATGVVALICGFYGRKASKLFFQIFGAIYAIIAGLGFYYGEQPILGIIANSMADNWLHSGIALISLFLGFRLKD